MNLTQTTPCQRVFYQISRADARISDRLDYIYCTAYSRGKFGAYIDDNKFQWEDV